MNRFYKFMFIWIAFFLSLTVWRLIFLPDQPTIFSIGSVTGSTTISVSVVNPDYHSYTKAVNQIQDYYVECSGYNLINITPIGNPIFLDNKTGGFCS